MSFDVTVARAAAPTFGVERPLSRCAARKRNHSRAANRRSPASGNAAASPGSSASGTVDRGQVDRRRRSDAIGSLERREAAGIGEHDGERDDARRHGQHEIAAARSGGAFALPARIADRCRREGYGHPSASSRLSITLGTGCSFDPASSARRSSTCPRLRCATRKLRAASPNESTVV